MSRKADGLGACATLGLPWHVMQVVSKMRCGVSGGVCANWAGWPDTPAGNTHTAVAMTARNRYVMVTRLVTSARILLCYRVMNESELLEALAEADSTRKTRSNANRIVP
jgi:hypothetical protein